MHGLMIEENMNCESDGRPPLTGLPKPCDYFDFIVPGGELLPYPDIMILKPHVYSYSFHVGTS